MIYSISHRSLYSFMSHFFSYCFIPYQQHHLFSKQVVITIGN